MSRILITMLLVMFVGQSMATKVYKWVDENGQIHYSSQKPVNQKVETIKLRKAPKVTAASEQADTEEGAETATDEATTDDAEDAAEAAAREQLAAADRVNRQKQCELAKNNYAALNRTIRVVKTNENGETVRMTDDERVKALATAQRGIDQYCN
ncbi:DUF4124 domain-containing protein [Marinicella sp. S1101]|uniref:DUF4124 domain-containing protein n=1 Tax=Marinicella marina TaxID=2996016 RepID=UPI0022608B53|nr:DUF4124 domain-containing protein [Marinicella marina]MCX7552669.1 DUF4124 domain-containing protein [Marinicella marina]MDJ1139545.1 DUF4124 domain-containing protein [Marinicella marina]